MIKRNLKLFKLDNFVYHLYPITILMVFYLQSITKSYAVAMLMLSITSITSSLMEIPTGVFSDKIGRRKTLILSGFAFLITALCFALAGSLDSVSLLVIGSLFMGISEAFLSGTDEALMYETAEELGQKNNFTIIYSKAGFWVQIGLLVAALIGAVITYFYDMVVLAWVGVVLIIPCVIIRFFYVEPKRTKKHKPTATFIHFRIALRRLWKNKRLRFYALVNIFDYSIMMSSNRFESAYFAGLVPLWVVNVARMVKQICGAIGFILIPKIKFLGSVKILFSSMIGNVIMRFFGVILNNIYTPFILSAGNIFYSTTVTATSDILHQEFSPQQRATMKSIMSFTSNIITAIAMYLLGVLADATSVQMAILFGVIAKFIVIILSLKFLKRK